MKLLIVEDEAELAASVVSYLSDLQIICEHVSSLESAREKLSLYYYDMLLVDIGLPDGSGLDLIRWVNSNKAGIPILIISAKDSVEDKTIGLDRGADDYLTKPFHLAELASRINAISRRSKNDGKSLMEINDMTFDPEERQVKINDVEIDLTRREFDILYLFVTNLNKVISKESIAEYVWGDNVDMMDDFNFVYTHIKNIRKKIQEAGGQDSFKSVYGVGYKFEST